MARSNGRIGIGVAGLSNQGRLVALEMLKTGRATIAAVCDVDDAVLERVAGEIDQHENQPEPTRRYRDYRDLLADDGVAAVVVATPDHWHAWQTVRACEAGKDVYCEKPLSWCIAEGRAMVDAARRHGRVVQTGSQQRSGPHFRKAMELVRQGRLGDVPYARAWISHQRGIIGTPEDEPVPAGVDYDAWIGPAPVRAFNRNRYNYQWRWCREFGTGEMGNFGAHWLDVVRWGLDLGTPEAVCGSGGRFWFGDMHEWPDTQMVLYDYPGRTVQWEMRLYTKRPLDGHNMGAAFYGTKGTLVITRAGYWIYGEDGQTLEAEAQGEDDFLRHMNNFLDCVESRDRPVADVEEGHKTAILCHLGNICLDVRRRLRFDGRTETFIDDDEANGWLTRTYRAPWTLQGLT